MRLADNIIATVVDLLKFLNIPTTTAEINQALKSHPEFPSLLSISEVLIEWGVQTEAVKGTITDLSKADCPGIVHPANEKAY